MATPLTSEERECICSLLAEGLPRNEIARKVGRSTGTVSNVARQEKHEFDQLATKKAQTARREYSQAERLGLINAGFDKAYELLDGIEKPSQFRDWTVGLGVLMDKRRQEDEGTADTAQLDVIFRLIDQQADDYETTMERETGMGNKP